ncbi:MAG: hypothetical protein AAB502_04135 [Chloroflexota bacterium]
MKWLLAVLAVLALLAVQPAPVLAAAPQPFTAWGGVVGVGSGAIQPLPVGFITRGEAVNIQIGYSPAWPELQGAIAQTVHKSTSLVTDPATGAIRGVGHGTITVSGGGLSAPLTGQFTFKISGHVNLSTGNIIDLHDEGVFNAQGGGEGANGAFTLDLDLSSFPPPTNVVVFKGAHRS